ncbi:MAG TPA: ATP-binding protein [Steroidobacteraceae bacterium]|nr:ATP-binding protein [Steroidobacteraceae bacterium]
MGPKSPSDPPPVPQPAELLAAIIASSEDAIASKTLQGIVTSWNTAAERLFGFAAHEMIGQSIRRVIPPELHPEEDRILEEIRAGHRIERYETVRLRKDGSRIHISLTVSPILDSAGRIVGAAKIAHDITRLHALMSDRETLLEAERTARAEAERMSRLKDEFLATLSHELRTPLNAIQGWSELLQHPGAKAEDVRRGLEAIARNVRIQAQIVNDLLDMSRVISGQVMLEVRPTSLQEILGHAIDAVRASAENKSIRIQTLIDSKIGPVRGDPTRLQQVLWNLLSNAVKFTPKRGRINVILERVDSHVEVTVEDTGIGIDPDFLPFVFERFRQGEAGISRRYGGLGIGLSIVKNLVELHGGSVRAKSPGKEQGSTFTVALPLFHVRPDDDRTSQTSQSDPLQKIELPRLDGTRVLLVDDDVGGCELVSAILTARGASVRCVASGADGLDVLSRESFDVVLSDVGMPEMDGYEFMRTLRKAEARKSKLTPAIAVTAYAGSADRQRALLSGYQMHIAKPIEAAELIAAIASLTPLTRT